MTAWEASDGGIDWRLELDRDRLLPGRLVAGRVTATAPRGLESRGLVVTLLGEEHWKYETTTTDAEGHTRTETRTGREDMPRVPVMVAGPLVLGDGESRTFEFELPVPALGPASLDADVAGVTWSVEAKVDREGRPDASIEVPVRIVQPVALLRAGAVRVEQFALFPSADVATDGVTGSIALDPVPLCPGEPFTGSVIIRPDGRLRLQEVRAELRVNVKATVASGKEETLVPWSAVIAPSMDLDREVTLELAGRPEDLALPTVELPHGRASAELHVILAKAWAADPHLVRPVALATTLEL